LFKTPPLDPAIIETQLERNPLEPIDPSLAGLHHHYRLLRAHGRNHQAGKARACPEIHPDPSRLANPTQQLGRVCNVAKPDLLK